MYVVVIKYGRTSYRNRKYKSGATFLIQNGCTAWDLAILQIFPVARLLLNPKNIFDMWLNALQFLYQPESAWQNLLIMIKRA